MGREGEIPSGAVNHQLLFFGPARLSTWLMLALLFGYGLYRRDAGRALLAPAAFLASFEALMDLSVMGHGRPTPPGAASWLLIGTMLAAAAVIYGFRPDLRAVASFALLAAIWLASGFHYNMDGLPAFSPWDEALNEATKTAFGLIYLTGGWRRTKPSHLVEDIDGGDQAHHAVGVAEAD